MEQEVSNSIFWLFCVSVSLLSPPSSWGMVEKTKLEGGCFWNGRKMSDPADRGLLDIVSKRRVLDTIYHQLSSRERDILYAHFASSTTPYYFTERIPKDEKDRFAYYDIYQVFGDLSPSAILACSLHVSELNKLCRLLLRKKCSDVQSSYLAQLKLTAQQEYKVAIERYFHLCHQKRKLL